MMDHRWTNEVTSPIICSSLVGLAEVMTTEVHATPTGRDRFGRSRSEQG